MTKATSKIGLMVLMVRICDGGVKAWWKEQLRTHIMNHKHKAESMLGMACDF